ncbi:MAG: TonB-dependent receptor [Candidatus Eisenbacteria bacterium]|nr:TonB-dependent receptor [Candidatus Eisenbacteria bacterium]
MVLDTVRVVAPRPSDAERLARSPGFSTALTVGPRGARDGGVAAELRRAPGLHVSTTGGPGAFATLSIRGSSAAQVGYYLDGVPLRWSEFGAVNLNDLPYESLARIEVHRGHVPFELGAGAPGGAVNLVSDTSRAVRARAAMAAGSYGDRQESFGASLLAAGATAHFALSHETYRGDFAYRSDNGTWFEAGDDTGVVRVNNDLDRWRGSLLATRGRVAVGAYAFSSAQGLPGPGYFQAYHSRFRSSGGAARVRARLWERESAGLLSAEAFYTRGEAHFEDPRGELKVGYLESRSTDQVLGARLHGTRRLGRGAELGAAIQQTVEHWAPEFVLPKRTARGANRSSGVLGARASLQRERLEATAGARAEWWADRGSTIDRMGRATPPMGGAMESRILPVAGVSVRALPGLWLKADAAVYQRLPSMSERFGVEGSQVGNPSLRPERGTSQDAGFAWRLARGPSAFELEGAYFWGTVTDAIVPEQNSQRTAIPQNSGRVRVSGEELRARAALGALEAEASATWLSAVDKSGDVTRAGKQLPGRPEFEAFARAMWNAGPLRPTLRAQHVGRNWLDRAHAEGSLAASRTLWALELEAPIEPAGLALRFALDNLTDRRASDLFGYPLPGRTARLTLRWTSAPGSTGPDAPAGRRPELP